jgi:hypothetical protein
MEIQEAAVLTALVVQVGVVEIAMVETVSLEAVTQVQLEVQAVHRAVLVEELEVQQLTIHKIMVLLEMPDPLDLAEEAAAAELEVMNAQTITVDLGALVEPVLLELEESVEIEAVKATLVMMEPMEEMGLME